MLPAGILAGALVALLAFAPFASAASDPLASGTTTIELNKSFTNYLKTFGIKTSKIGSTKLKGNKASFTVSGGALDPTNGSGEVNLAGGIQFKAGKKKAPVKSLVLDTKHKVLMGKVGGKSIKLATIAGWSYARNGFGVNLTVKKLKMTSNGANALNKALGFSKGNPKPFLKNKLVGKAAATTQPSTVNVLPIGNMTYSANPTLLEKLHNVKAELQTLGLTTQTGTVFTGPILGGTISPLGTAGVVQSGIGFKMVQNLPTSPSTAISTTISLGGVYIDLAAKTATVEVIAESNAEVENPSTHAKTKPLNLGNLGRSSIADLTVTGVNANAATRTVAINTAAVLQPISAEVLQGFVSVYKGYAEAGTFQGTCQMLPNECAEPAEQAIAAEEAKKAGEAVAKNSINAGEGLGTFSFTAQAE